MSGVRAGLAVRALPAPVGMDMTGYIGRPGPAEGMHDPLHVRAAAFEAGGSAVVLVSCELLGFAPEAAAAFERRAAERAGLPAAHVITCCTHTHSGPASMHLQDCGTVDAAWLDRAGDLVAEAAAASVQSLAPAELSLSRGTCGAAFNRVAGPDPAEDARVDAEVLALHVTPRGRPRPPFVLANWACHPVTLAEPNRLYTADFPGYAEAALREAGEQDLQLVYLQGCCGDLNPRERGSFGAAERTGRALAAGIREAVPVITDRELDDARVEVRSAEVELALVRRWTEAGLSALLAEPALPGESEIDRKVRGARAAWARRLLDGLAAGTLTERVKAVVRVARVGPLTIAALPFEPFNEVGRAIKDLLGAWRTMTVGYAGGDLGYLPSERLYERAGYEVGDAHVYYGYPGPVPRDAAARVTDALRACQGES